eukprot:1525958-Amphidinium_carterae.6
MIATLHCKTQHITPPPRLHRRFIDDSHKTKFISKLVQSIDQYKSNPLTHNLHPALQLHQVELLAQQAMQSTAPARVRPPTKSWLRLPTLRLLYDLTTLRKAKTKFHKDHNSTPPLITKHNKHLPFSTIYATSNRQHITHEYRAAISIRVKQARKLIKIDKAHWIDEVCTNVDKLLQSNKTGLAFQQIRRLNKNRSAHRTSHLLDSNGVAQHDPQILANMWLTHWTQHFQAHGNTGLHHHFPLPDCDHTTSHSTDQHTSPSTIDLQASVDHIDKLLQRLASGKAITNVISTDVFKVGHAQFAPFVTRLINTIVATGFLPHSLLGSVVVPVPKKSGHVALPTNFRPIQLQRLERKLCGQYLLSRLRHHMQVTCTQHCVGVKAGVDNALFTFTQATSLTYDKKFSSCIYFVDIGSAYDSIIHELVFADGDTTIKRKFDDMVTSFDFDHQVFRSASDYIQRHPDSLINSTIPTPLRTVLKRWLDSWMTTQYHWGNFQTHIVPKGDPAKWNQLDILRPPPLTTQQQLPSLETTKGVKQGDPLSTIIFTTYLAISLHYIMDRFTTTCEQQQWRVFPSYEVPCDRQLFQRPHGGQQPMVPPESIQVPHLDYADDIAFILSHEEPATVLKAVKELIIETIHGFRAFGLETNLKAHKSGLLLGLHGPSARGIWQYLKVQGAHQAQHEVSDNHHSTTPQNEPSNHSHNHTYFEPQTHPSQRSKMSTLPLTITESITVHIVPHYQYLGKQLTSNLSQTTELRARKQAATTAFTNNAAVLTSINSTINCKIRLYKTLVLPHLLQQVHTIATYTTHHITQLERLHAQFLKKVCRLHINTPHTWFHTQDSLILDLLGEPPLRVYIMQRRLNFMRKVIVSEDKILRAMTAVSGKTSMWPCWLRDLALLRDLTPTLTALPIPTKQTFATWLHYIIPGDTTWTALLKHHTTHTHTPARNQYALSLTALYDPYTHGEAQLPPHDQQPPPPPPAIAAHRPFNADRHCNICFKEFNTTKGLLSHKRGAHNIHNPLSLRLHNTTCPTCSSQLQTRSELLQHLANRPECSLPMMELPAMTTEQYNASIWALNHEDATFTRERIPKRGPIPTIEGVPRSQHEQLLNPFI